MGQQSIFEFGLQVFERDEKGPLRLYDEVLRAVAASPEDAANKLLHEQLRPMGEPDQVRAKTWRIAPGGKPIVTMLYR